MATTVNSTRTKATDIQEICAALDGVVNFESITFSQRLICAHGESINDLQYVDKIRGIYFYTSSHMITRTVCHLANEKLPTYVCCPNSKNVYELK